MKITEVCILRKDSANKRLAGFASVTLDYCLVVRDIRIIRSVDNTKRQFYLSMPSRPERTRCICGRRNVFQARFCNWCGRELSPYNQDEKAFFDVAFPCTSWLREHMERHVLEAYQKCVAMECMEVKMSVSEEIRHWCFEDGCTRLVDGASLSTAPRGAREAG